MLETEEFDDDYFTPVASASLANIFGKSVTDDQSDNESLKYVPPKPHNTTQQQEDSKTTSCVFACALVAYVWHGDVYTQKGKLGFALIKILKSAAHNIILYDSNKTTLSSASVSSKLKIDYVKNNNYLSYYDDQMKYWSVYGAADEIVKIIDLLKLLGATIVTSDVKNPTELKPSEHERNEKNANEALQQDKINELPGSDTDSSINRKTKASILNRMANLGHPKLLPKVASKVQTSDSDTDYDIKVVNNKASKGVIRKNSMHKNTSEQINIDSVDETGKLRQSSVVTHKNTLTSDQLVPLSHTTTILTNPSQISMELLLTEQKINNSELRINLGRITDRVDQIITKINDLEMKDYSESSAKVNTEIINKLLREYENKIQGYENVIKQMGGIHNIQMASSSNSSIKPEESLKSKNEILENVIKEKDRKVTSLQVEVNEQKQQNIILHKNISDLESLIKDITEKNETLNSTAAIGHSENVNKIKLIMNDTYQAVESNFENDNTYSGETIKKTICSIIRKITLLNVKSENN